MMQARFERRKIVKTQSLGEIFRETRLYRGYQLDEVARRCMMPADFVEYLEKGKYESLPARVYVEGYVRKVAGALQLNQEAMVKIYKREVGIQENIAKEHERDKKTDRFRKPKIIFNPTIMRNAAIIFLIIAAAGYLWYQMSSLSKPPELALVEPSSDQETESDELLVLGHLSKGATLSINGQSVFVNESGEFKETLSLNSGSNTIEIRAENRLGRTTTVTRQIFSNAKKQVAAAGAATGPVKTRNESTEVDSAAVTSADGGNEQADLEKVTLGINIIDLATWIQVEVDGKIEFSGTMLPGSSKEFIGNDYVTLTSGKAHKTLVTFNGDDIGVLSSEGGVVRDLRFDRDTKL